MALFIQQKDSRSELQERLATELREKAKKAAGAAPVDGVTDSNYLKNTKTTTPLAGVWVLVAILAVVALVAVMVILN